MLIQCVICYEFLKSTETIDHTPCGHVFHRTCLAKWFERSKTCPECREAVAETAIKRIYLNFSTENLDEVSAALKAEYTGVIQVLGNKELEIVSKYNRLKTLLRIALRDRTVWRHTIEVQRKVLQTAKNDIARLTNERDESINSSQAHWEKISRMFHGVRDHGSLVEMIAVMKRQFEANVATLAIDKIVLQKRINDLQAMLPSDGTSGSSPRRTLDEVDAHYSVPTKKLKTTTADSGENDGFHAEPIDVIDLTKETIIDLTETDIIETIPVEEVEVR